MSPEEHIEYSPFEVERFCESFSHKKRSGFRIYPGVVGEAD